MQLMGRLVAARMQHEQDQLPGRLESVARRTTQFRPTTAAPAALKLDAWQHIGPFAADSLAQAFEQDVPSGSKVSTCLPRLTGKAR